MRLLGTPIPNASVVADHRQRLLALLLAVGAGIVVYWIASTVFPFHSNNHDEGVYLQQAAMLIEGRLRLTPGDAYVEAFRPWFFVQEGGQLYPKYSPVVAAMYAPTMALLGEPRISLAVVAAANVLLVYVLGTISFDRSVGVVAAAAFAASPMALVTSSVFLPYAPTALLNLAFAVFYLRAVRDDHLPSAALAGAFIGLAFFSRPFTAVLFAAPFIVHAAVSMGRALSEDGLWPPPAPAKRSLTTAGFGICFVGLTLAYNAVLTGSAAVFPYEAFAPLDGPGFGPRRILGHSIDYTPSLALRANAYVTWYLLSRWFVGGVLGAGCAIGGLAIACVTAKRCRGWIGRDDPWLPLAGLLVTIPAGNVAFWGNYNILATVSDPTDGLVSLFGPFYHFDMLAPLSIFAALFLVTAWRWTGRRIGDRRSNRRARPLVVLGAILVVLALGVTTVGLASEPLNRNLASTEAYEAAYEPIDTEELSNALVFLPTPYGPWMNHPFQYLRNDPGLDGPTVYALTRGPASDFAILDRYPDRAAHRFTYRGRWTPNPNRKVTPALQPLSIRSGDRLRGETLVGAPDRIDLARIQLENGAGESVEYTVEGPGRTIAVDWELDGSDARLPTVGDESSVPLDRTDVMILTVTLVDHDGSTFTYRQETKVRSTPSGVEAVWPSRRATCPLVLDCGTEGTYLPDREELHREWERFDVSLVESNG